jgi:GT2 family glycosyltransferase
MKKVPVIIPHYRYPERLAKCQAHLQAQEGVEVEVYVRDNNTDNIFYTAAINEGLRKYCHACDAEYVLILNQDAYLDPSTLKTLLGFMDANPMCGIASPIHVSADRQRVTWGGATRAFPFGGHRCDPLESYLSPSKTHWANGACMLIRTETVREVGLFDKNMRFICSDADFSFTARLRGWTVFVVPGPLCVHDVDTSANSTDETLTLVKLYDALYFAQKWLDGGLYRQVAWEGQILKDQDVRAEIDARKREIQFIQQRLASQKAAQTK